MATVSTASPPRASQDPTSSNSVEMTDLDPSKNKGVQELTSQPDIASTTTTAVASSSQPAADAVTGSPPNMKTPFPSPDNASPSALAEVESTRPNIDSITPNSTLAATTTTATETAATEAGSSTDARGPVCDITLLLTSAARHPYKLDEKYLIKRNVAVPGTTESGRKDPFSISVYTLKELILREWREEWEAKPSSPSSIRLIHFGRLLDDKVPLKECRFNTDSPNVVHMTVRPQEVVDEEDASKAKGMGRDRDGSERTAGCRCTIM